MTDEGDNRVLFLYYAEWII